jgi:hypothetical protein
MTEGEGPHARGDGDGASQPRQGDGTREALGADGTQLERFVGAMFRHAHEGGTVSLRAFYDDALARKRDEKPFQIRGVRLNGGGFEPVVRAATKLAEAAARATRPVVVASPLATFAGGGKADERNLLEGLALSVELDEGTVKALAALRAVIGPPTLVVASGGVGTAPATGEGQDKLHVHWRLDEPTQTPEEHRRLKRARALACELVGADATAKPVVHPMRWPGTWHRKNPDAPRLAHIVEENPDGEISLEDVLSELEGLALLRGEAGEGLSSTPEPGPMADDDLLEACAERIPNPDLDWAAWNRLGMAFWRASGGSEAGFAAFDAFSRKSRKHDAEATRARWEHYGRSPPSRIGAPTLVWEARKADPGFRSTRAKPDPEREEAGGESDHPRADGWEGTLRQAVEEVNRRYFVAEVGGRGVIGSLVRDAAMDRERLVFSRPSDVKLLYNHRHYVVGISQKGNEIWKDLGTAWVEHPRRRNYASLALIPNGPVPPGVFNLWRGFGVKPRTGDWPLIRRHLLEIICGGDQAHHEWLVRWMANCVQHPERQAEVAVVLRGKKGTGKGTAGKIMARIFRDHALQITHSRHLTGNFNAHLVDALFLFLDEAFWAGDKQGEGVLKGLVTEPTLMIEPKGIDPFPMPNRLKILIASNHDWVVPASPEERRYFVLDVADGRRGDRAYFSALHAAIEGDELPGFLAHLLTLPLADFDHRNPPHTAALNEQKLISADSLTKFWLDCLTQGGIVGSEVIEGWPEDVVVQVLHAAYQDHAHAHGDRHPLSDARMAKELQKLLPGRALPRVRPHKPWGAVQRPPRYRLPGLDHARTAFLEGMGVDPADHAWPVEEAA